MDEKNIMLDDVLNNPGLFADTDTTQVEQGNIPPDGQAAIDESSLQEAEAAQGDNTVEVAPPQTEPPLQQTDGSPTDTDGAIPEAGVQQSDNLNPAMPQDFLMQVISGMQNQINTMQQALQQQSETQEQAIAGQMQQPEQPTPPNIDFNELIYADDDSRAAKQQEWIASMSDYIKQTTLGEMEPIFNDYKTTKERQEYGNVVEQLKSVPDLSERFGASIDEAGTILEQMPTLKQLAPQEAIITAALIAKGRQAVNTIPQQETPEQLAQKALNNPEVMKIIAMHNVDQVKQNANIPTMAAGQGAISTAPINVQRAPETLEEGLKFLEELI